MQIWDHSNISETTRARKLKFKTELDMVKCSFWVQKKSAVGAGTHNVNFGAPNISESTGARKLKLKRLLDIVKCSSWVHNFSARRRPGSTWPLT